MLRSGTAPASSSRVRVSQHHRSLPTTQLDLNSIREESNRTPSAQAGLADLNSQLRYEAGSSRRQTKLSTLGTAYDIYGQKPSDFRSPVSNLMRPTLASRSKEESRPSSKQQPLYGRSMDMDGSRDAQARRTSSRDGAGLTSLVASLSMGEGTDRSRRSSLSESREAEMPTRMSSAAANRKVSDACGYLMMVG